MTSSVLLQSLGQRDAAATDNTARRELGRQHFAAVMIYWLAKNDWSHPNFETLATWALGEAGCLHTSQVSHMRNGKMRMVGVKVIDAFGAINTATWAYHNDREALKALGTGTITPDIEGMLKDAIWIEDPALAEMDNRLPLDAGGWMNVYLGYTRIEGVVGGAKGEADFEAATLKLGKYIYKTIQASGMDFIEAKEVLAKSMTSPAADKLIAAAVGLDKLTTEDLRTQITHICEALERLDGRNRTPEGLLGEL